MATFSNGPLCQEHIQDPAPDFDFHSFAQQPFKQPNITPSAKEPDFSAKEDLKGEVEKTGASREGRKERGG